MSENDIDNDLSLGLKKSDNDITVNNLSKNDNSEDMKNENKSLSNDLNNSIDEKDLNPMAEINEFKVILLGNSGVGKTSIFNRFTSGEFSSLYKSTLTVEFKCKLLKFGKNIYAKLVVWDTVGTERFRAITRQYFRGANGVVLIFDLTDQSSFNGLKNWIEDIKNSGEKYIEIILVGNKSDLENRTVTDSQAKRFAKENNFKYFETSAKEGSNILLIFEQLSKAMNKNLEKIKEDYINSQLLIRKIEPIQKQEKKEKGCC